MPSIDHHDLVLRIEDLGTESAAHWASRAVTMGATEANISDGGSRGLVLTISFPPSAGNRAALDLANMLAFVAEIEGVSASNVLARVMETREQG
ncbi:hypothetical protein [Geodermatophilus chilensis]|uniref:hypothetical protein n=1 Tax=Geodermatophilus chilensis TaxID=2035835 RepID=UPI000C265420|nr:hypothetical protein [Geodermatophilus chilensis]